VTRVLIVEAAGNLWGSERSLLDMLTSVPTLDIAVCCPPGRPLVSELERRGIRTFPTFVYRLHEKSRLHRIDAAIRLVQTCLAFRPNVIHLNQSGSYKVALAAARLLDIPIVAHVRIFEDAAYLAKQRPDPGRLRGLVAISGAVEEEIRRFAALDVIPLHRIYNAYVSQAPPPAPAPVTRRPIACVGRLVPIKGQDVLVGAIGWLKQSGSAVECVMAGDGQETFTAQLKALAGNLDVASSIRWAGFVGDIGQLLQTCTILVCPSHREPLGRVIYDAWDAGIVPVVFGGSGGAAEIVSAAGGGILYDAQTPESLGRALQAALDLDDVARARLVRNGRTWMAANSSPEAYGEALGAILARASAAPSGRAITRALVIEGAGNLWGSERSLLDLVEAMPAVEVAVCCPPGTPLNRQLEARMIPTLPYYVAALHEKPRWRRVVAALGVLRACLAFKPDVIHLNQSGSYKVTLMAAALLGIPIVAHVRIFEDVAYLARQRPSPRLLRAIVAISRAVEAEIRQFPQLAAIPVHTLYDGFVSSRRWLTSSGAKPPVKRVACVGRLVPIKGQDVFVRALGLMKASTGDVEGLIVGDGEAHFARELRRLAESEGVTGMIRWPGFVPDIAPLLRTCDVLACPSHREPLGRVILEAWDAGAIPVVFSGSGGAAEIVAASGGGFVYDRQDPEALAAALRQALELSPDEAARLIGCGRTWMAANCNPATYGRTLAAILTHAGSRPGAAA
jgi:glycosyltransferase involved in cell wall biosynthesis